MRLKLGEFVSVGRLIVKVYVWNYVDAARPGSIATQEFVAYSPYPYPIYSSREVVDTCFSRTTRRLIEHPHAVEQALRQPIRESQNQFAVDRYAF